MYEDLICDHDEMFPEIQETFFAYPSQSLHMSMRYFKKIFIAVALFFSYCVILDAQNKIVVFQSDFGLKDGAVSAMKGVALGVSPDLKLYDLTH
ncbi:MAG: SAM-dependent chlorinase/fluorinase, partial [Ferruginibacter sp.]